MITRTKGVVKTKDASDLNLGKSKHEAFMQLLQLEEYQTGSEIMQSLNIYFIVEGKAEKKSLSTMAWPFIT